MQFHPESALREGLRTKVPTAAGIHNRYDSRRYAPDGEWILRRGRRYPVLPQVLGGNHGRWPGVGCGLSRGRRDRCQPKNAPVWRQGDHLLRAGSRRKTAELVFCLGRQCPPPPSPPNPSLTRAGVWTSFGKRLMRYSIQGRREWSHARPGHGVILGESTYVSENCSGIEPTNRLNIFRSHLG